MVEEMDRLIFYITLFFSILSCKTNVDELWQEQLFAFDLSDNYNAIVLSNSSNKSVHFNFSLNKKFPVTQEMIMQEIGEISREKNVADYIAAWKYVVENTYSSNPLTNENWQHHPFIFINSVGGGFCDDKASVLAQLWQYLDYQVRVVNIGGHVVAEVLANNKWQMFDPDTKTFFCDSSNQILSVAEMEKAFNNNSPEEILCSNYYFNRFLTGSALSRKYADYFTTTFNNTDETNWHIGELDDIQSTFTLPSHSKLKLVFQNNHILSIFVELSEKSEGWLYVPLVVKEVYGDFSYLLSNNLQSSHNLLNNNLLPSVEIKKVTIPASIEYYVNNKPAFLQNQNSIAIQSDNELIFTLENTETSTEAFGQAYLFFDTASFTARYCGAEINLIHSREYFQDSLYDAYQRFTYCMNSSSIISKEDFYQIITGQIENNDIYFNRLLFEKQPLSIFYLFLSIHHNKVHFINQVARDSLREYG
jgi:hypothetical protein